MSSGLLSLGMEWGGPPLHPAMVFLAGAVLVAVLGRRRTTQAVVMVATPLLGAVCLLTLAEGSVWELSFHSVELALLRVDRLSLLFALLFHLGALLGAIYALKVRDTTQQVAALAYAGAALAAVLAGDLLTLLFAWEAMTVTSAFLVFARRTRAASAAGVRYLLLQVLSGLLLLGGALLAYDARGSLAFDRFVLGEPWTWMILAGFGIKCGFPLVHTWITDAYPQSTPAGTVFLSMFTTKVGVYALARGFPGTELLIVVGAVMAVFPIFYAVIENDLRRVLGYSMINQIGFMVVGIGLGTELALNGAVAHAFNEVLFKGLLFMSMGAVLLRAGTMSAADLGGLYRTMPRTAALCIVGALSISAFPLFNAFVSKGMILAAALHDGPVWVWYALLFASAGVFHHAGIKIPYFAFFGHDSGVRTREAPGEMQVAMALAAAGCILVGTYPPVLTTFLPWPVEYEAYSYAHVALQLQLLLFSALAFVALQLSGLYPSEIPSVNLDTDWLVRGAGRDAVVAVDAAAQEGRLAVAKRLLVASKHVPRRWLHFVGPNGYLARGGTVASGVLAAAVVLLAMLVTVLLRDVA